MMMAVLGFGLDIDLRIINALKTLAVMAANVVAPSSSCSSPTSTGSRSCCWRGAPWSVGTSARTSDAGCRRPCSGRSWWSFGVTASVCSLSAGETGPSSTARSGIGMTSSDVPEGIDVDVPPSGTGCADCDAATPPGWWVHLRRCAACGHIGCCDTSRRSTRPRTRSPPDTRSSRASSRARTGSTTTRPVRPFDGPCSRPRSRGPRTRLDAWSPRPGAAGLDGAHPPLSPPLCRARSAHDAGDMSAPDSDVFSRIKGSRRRGAPTPRERRRRRVPHPSARGRARPVLGPAAAAPRPARVRREPRRRRGPVRRHGGALPAVGGPRSG